MTFFKAQIVFKPLFQLTGHKAIASLLHYDPSNNAQNKVKMAGAILLAKPALKRKSSEEDKENQPLLKIAAIEDENHVVDLPQENDPVAAPQMSQFSSSSGGVEMVVLRQQELRRQELSNERARIDNANENSKMISSLVASNQELARNNQQMAQTMIMMANKLMEKFAK